VLVDIRAGDVRLSGQSMSVAEAVAELTARVSTNPELRAFLRPDAEVSLQRTIDVMDALAAVDLAALSLVGEPAR
jgi:biopolymer transport protein ExbD